MSPRRVNLVTNLWSERRAKPRIGRLYVSKFCFVAMFYLSIMACSLGQESTSNRMAREADEALRTQNYDLAIADYREFLRSRPSAAGAWSNLGAAWLAKGSLSLATDSFTRAARLQPANGDYAFNAALALVRLDKCDAADRFLVVSLQAPRHRTASLFMSGLCAFVAQEWSLARETLAAAEAGGCQTAETYYMLTIASRKSQSPNEARRAFDLLKSRFPNSSLFHELLGEALDEDSQSEEAQKELSMAIANSPYTPGLHAKLGLLMWKAHRLDDAAELFDQELAIDPRSYSAMHYLGDIAEQNSQLPQALIWYGRALQEQPKSGEAHFAAGRVLELEDRSEEALREFQASLPALENDASVHYWTAKALRRLGMREQANMELAKVQEINKAARNMILTMLGSGEQ